MTGRELIAASLRSIGVLASGEPMNDTEANESLGVLNGMINRWATQKMVTFVETISTYALTVNQVSYTIGPTGNFVQQRPVWIDRASWVQNVGASNELELPITVLKTDQQWQGIPNKQLTSALPLLVYYSPTFPNGVLYPWPILSAGPLSLRLYWPTQLASFADLTTDYTFPPGYEEALKYNLAIRLAPEFGRQTPADIIQFAQNSLADIKRVNQSYERMMLPPELLNPRMRVYDWRSDTWR
jgi:hypothetical protein